ncbi:unnamed protein product [Rotaria sp. Silwood2]|nr:unnamed protein product [Rotaria sp. Silwood2]
MGFANSANKNCQEAISCFKIVLDLQSTYLLPNDPNIIRTCNNIGTIYRQLDDYDAALETFTQVTEIERKSLPMNSFEYTKTLNNIGFIYCHKEKLTNALHNFEKALEIQLTFTNIQPEEIAVTYNNIASIYLRQNKYDLTFVNAKKILKHCPRVHKLLEGNTIFGFKRLIGRKFDDATVQADMKHWPFKIINDNGKPKIQVEYKNQIKLFTPEELSSMILANMKDIAEIYLGKNISKAIITVPAYFNYSERQNVKQ